MSIEARVDLIVAAMDLKLVRLLRDAMRAADAGVGVTGPLGTLRLPALRRRIEPDPRIEPRQSITPAPRFEPRKVIHPQDRFEPQPNSPIEPEQPSRIRCPIQPPWRVLPWQTPAPLPVKVKLVLHRPDIVSKGSLIDFFI